MLRLIKAAVMPVEGSYRLCRISKEWFIRDLREAARIGDLESYIGNSETALYIEQISGVTIHTNQEKLIVNDGDTLLICKLHYRVAEPMSNGIFAPTDEDYEFFICFYAN